MIRCEEIEPQLTAYLDGELEGPAGSVVRGHLRGCEACRAIATDEAALRDGLRALPAADVPASMWAGVQARLAAAEVADAERPSWRRAVARWTPSVRRLAPTFGAVGLAAAAAAALIVWRAHGRAEDAVAPAPPGVAITVPIPALSPDTALAPSDRTAPSFGGAAGVGGAHGSDPRLVAPSDDDVTADLAHEAARTSAAYAATADNLAAQLADVRSGWPADRRQQFDARLADLRIAVAGAGEGRGRQRALRAEIRYLQGALIRDEIASNDRVLAAPGRLR